jgi:N6-L-threonylcarbamoyladenine synthase
MAAAVVRGREILASVVHAQIDVHAPYGGVVPELASRDHVRCVSQVVGEALRCANVTPSQLGGVAVTAGPGLVGSLLVGLCFGKAFAMRHGLPVVGVHHVAGHLASAELADERLTPPYLGLVVSGGHTALYRIEADGPPALLGETLDDAVGEAFDKVAKLLGPIPAVPSREAEAGDERDRVPAPDAGRAELISYSGLEDGRGAQVEKRGAAGALDARNRGPAASFQAVDRRARAKARRALRARAWATCSRRWLRTNACREVEPLRAPTALAVSRRPRALYRQCRDDRRGRRAQARARRARRRVARRLRASGAALSRAEVRALLERRGLRAHKARGQNFLTDERIAAQIALDAPVSAGDAVIEIGPGLGVLTRALAARARAVVAIEIDAGLVRALRDEASCRERRARPRRRARRRSRRARARARPAGARRRESPVRGLDAAAAPPPRPP